MYSKIVDLASGELKISTHNNITFNVFLNDKEVDVWTDYRTKSPGKKIKEWLEDNQEWY